MLTKSDFNRVRFLADRIFEDHPGPKESELTALLEYMQMLVEED